MEVSKIQRLTIAQAELYDKIMDLKNDYVLSNDDILSLIGNLLMNHDWTVEDEEN